LTDWPALVLSLLIAASSSRYRRCWTYRAMGYVFTVAIPLPTSYELLFCNLALKATFGSTRNKGTNTTHTHRVRQLSAPGFALVGKANDESSICSRIATA
jgi:hypothetical protein